MKAVQLSQFGAPDVLEIVELPIPIPGPGEVVIRIRAAGINFFETLVRKNRYAVTPQLPMVPGVEVAGVVEALGEGVDPDLIGRRVAVPLFAVGRPAGGYAESISVNASDVVAIPDGLHFEQAVALLVQGLTAALLVRQSSPQGKTIAVTAATGGVGSLLIQLAKHARWKIGSLPAKWCLCRKMVFHTGRAKNSARPELGSFLILTAPVLSRSVDVKGG
jgi:NADPH2:quinone reductase